MALFAYRLFGAAMLDPGVYEGIEADRSATRQALATVLLSSLAAGVGAAGWHGPSPMVLLVFSAIALLTWVTWAMLMFQIGARLLPGRDTETSLDELMRTIGFAAAPGLLQVFAVFPRMGMPVFVLAWAWMFAATVTAVRQALDYHSTVRTLAVCGIAAALAVALAFGLGVVFGPVLS
jgi:hypothetical protein